MNIRFLGSSLCRLLVETAATSTQQDKTVSDPVCGTTVNPATTSHRHKHLDKTYYLGSVGNRAKSVADPARYLKGKSAPSEPVAEAAIDACPMHPEIRSAGHASFSTERHFVTKCVDLSGVGEINTPVARLRPP